MAGHRRVTGKPKKAQARRDSWRGRIASADSSERYYDVASDWLRAAVSHVPDPARQTEILNTAGRYLAGLADKVATENIR